MSDLRTLPQSFVGGELSPRMYGRPDDPKYQHGAARLRNFYVDPSGAASNRPGTELVRSSRNDATRARLINFDRSGNRSIQVEFGQRQEYPGSSTVPGYARFHADGGTQLYATAWSAATAYLVGDQVLQGGQLYRCRLANTNQVPPNATYWETLEYVPNKTFVEASVNVGSNEISFASAHNLETAEPIEFTSDSGTLPAPLGPNVLFFAIIVDADTIKVATTEANAIAGTAIDLTDDGSTGAQHRMHRRYFDGELVSQSGVVFYCRRSRPIDGSGLSIPANSGNETYWYQEPSTGELEVPTTLTIGGDELFAMTYSQQGNILSLAAAEVQPAELRRQSAYNWTWNLVSFAPSIAAPTSVVATATKRGATLAITGFVGVGPGGVRLAVNTETEHKLTHGLDSVWIEGSLAGTSINDKFWRTEAGNNASQFVLIHPDTGSYVAGTTIGAGGTARITSLFSDTSNSYVVTAVSGDLQESTPSATATVANNLFVSGAYNTITWTAVTGASRYRVYKLLASTGLYGFIGETTEPSFKDGPPPYAAQLSQTPPILDTTLAVGDGTWPRAVTHHEGRRAFGGPDSDTQRVWLTRSNTESDLSSSIPVKATDRIQQRIKARKACTIRHLVSVGQTLVALCDTAEIRIGPIDSEALTPESFAARPQSYIGAAAVQPEVMQNVILFAAASGGHVYQMGWRDDVGGYLATDLCERASHLFDGFSIVQMASQLAPIPIDWCVTSDGRLLGITFVPAQQVFAWHWHDTDGFVESVAVGPSGGEHRVTAMVRRTINGVTKRYVERLRSMSPQAWNDNWFVDCGLRLETTAAVSTIANLGHLEGKEVAVFTNGLVQARQTVVGAQITLETPLPAGNNKVLVGLPITGQLRTVPATFAVEAYGSGRPKSVSKVFPRVEASGSFLIGTSEQNLLPASEITTPGQPYSGLVEQRVEGNWTMDGQLFLEQRDPLPLTVVSITAEMAVGG